MSIISRKIDGNNGLIIGQRRKDGYVNATAMCKVSGKRVADYIRNKGTQGFLEKLSEGNGLNISVLVEIHHGGRHQEQGTWIHPDIYPHFYQWLTRGRQGRVEQVVQEDLAMKTRGKREVKVLAGKIDVLTSKQVIEIKHVNYWITAVGQVLIYGSYYPSHEKRLHLFGETQESMMTFISAHCEKLGIVVTWEP